MKVQEIKMEGEFTNSTKKLGYSKINPILPPLLINAKLRKLN